MTSSLILVSDLHVDAHALDVDFLDQSLDQSGASVVVVAGDTADAPDALPYLRKLKAHLAARDVALFAIDGNHEHWGNTKSNTTIKERERQFRDAFPNTMRFNDRLTIVGACGWYPVSDMVSFLDLTKEWRHSGQGLDIDLRARANAAELDHMILNAPGRVIVVTHTAPTSKSLDAKYNGHPANRYYWSPYLTKVMDRHSHRIAVWLHGHTHSATSIVSHTSTRIVCNPRGYPDENPDWKPLVISKLA